MNNGEGRIFAPIAMRVRGGDRHRIATLIESATEKRTRRTVMAAMAMIWRPFIDGRLWRPVTIVGQYCSRH